MVKQETTHFLMTQNEPSQIFGKCVYNDAQGTWKIPRCNRNDEAINKKLGFEYLSHYVI